MTLERQASSKESRERRGELWELARGDGTSGGVPKDRSKLRSLIERVSGSDQKFVSLV